MIDRYSASAISVAAIAIAAFIAIAVVLPAFITLSGISASCTLLGLYGCISEHRMIGRARSRRLRPVTRHRRAA
jgi:hypothetical protein